MNPRSVDAAASGPQGSMTTGVPGGDPRRALDSGLVELIAAATSERTAASPEAAPEGASPTVGSPVRSPDGTVPAGPTEAASPAVLVGLCVDDRHPTLAGRVRVRVDGPGGPHEFWLATLANLPVRPDDRVILLQPANWPEPLVVGVIDGLRARTPVESAAASLTLKSDETLEIRDQDGAALLAIVPTPEGPLLRLARADQKLEIAGRLSLVADVIDLTARGEMSLAAGGDVVVTGEEIKLN